MEARLWPVAAKGLACCWTPGLSRAGRCCRAGNREYGPEASPSVGRFCAGCCCRASTGLEGNDAPPLEPITLCFAAARSNGVMMAALRSSLCGAYILYISPVALLDGPSLLVGRECPKLLAVDLVPSGLFFFSGGGGSALRAGLDAPLPTPQGKKFFARSDTASSRSAKPSSPRSTRCHIFLIPPPPP